MTTLFYYTGEIIWTLAILTAVPTAIWLGVLLVVDPPWRKA